MRELAGRSLTGTYLYSLCVKPDTSTTSASKRSHCWTRLRFVSFDIKFTRQGFENACWHREACRDIENTRFVSFDIKFTRQGFENACWHREACRAIQQAFSKPSLVNLISKDTKLVFYLSVFPLLTTLQTSDYDVIFDFCVDSASLATSLKKCNVIMTW